MSLFEITPKKKRGTLEYSIVVGELTEDEYKRLIKWVNENIPSTERYTPDWKTDDDFFTNPLLSQSTMTSATQKVTFRFRHEDQAMAFKLVL